MRRCSSALGLLFVLAGCGTVSGVADFVDALSSGCLVTEAGIEQMEADGMVLPLPPEAVTGRYEAPGDWYRASSGCLVPGDISLEFVHCEVTAEGLKNRGDFDSSEVIDGTGPAMDSDDVEDWYRGAIFKEDPPGSLGSYLEGDTEAGRERLEELLRR